MPAEKKRELAKEYPEDAQTYRDVRDGKLTPKEGLREALERHGKRGIQDPGPTWNWPSVPRWAYYIPVGLALIVILGCLFDLAQRIARRSRRWRSEKGVSYKHYVPRAPEPPPSPTPPTGSPTDTAEDTEDRPDLRVLDPETDESGDPGETPEGLTAA